MHVDRPWFNRQPERTTRKKVMLHNVLSFSGPPFWLEKNSFVQKVSKSFGFLNFVESRFQFILKSLYFWDRVSTFLKKWSRPVTVWFPFDKMNFHPAPIGHLDLKPCGTSDSADHDCDIVQRKLHLLISFVPLTHLLFCEFRRPPVPKFRGGSEFLTGNWIWEWFLIHLIYTNISRRQVL